MAARLWNEGDRRMSERDQPNSSNLVDLSGVRPTPPSDALARIERYWGEVRGRRLVPSRAEIDPRGLTGVLSHAFVLERISTGLARFRIAGSHLTGLTGMEVRGMPLSALFVPEARPTLAASLVAAFDDPSIIRFALEAETGFGKPAMTGDMVLLPLRSDLGEISRCLGGIVLHGDAGRTPRRLQIAGEARTGLTGIGALDGDVTYGFGEPKPVERPDGRPAEPASRPRPVRQHLTLVVDNDA